MEKQKKLFTWTAGLLTVGVLSAAPSGEHGRPFTEQKIPSHARGPAIIEQLGERLPEVARWNGMTAEDFIDMVNHDHATHLDERGQVYYVCEGMAIQESPTLDQGTTSFTEATSGEAFNLASLPGADLTIYLDFDGHVTSGTSWNSRVGGADIVTPPYDTDGNKSAFSASELGNIVAIWKRVVEDYAPWQVNVTTVDPGEDALKRTSTTDTQYGIRVVIGGSSTDWYGTAGGVAYIGSFNWSSDTPCYVFEDQLGNGNIKYTAEATSHEVGHTFSLRHDGDSSTEYYQGHANWAPIMGVGYYKPVVQWSKGEYANANNAEDDVAKISAIVPLRADLAADDMQSESLLGLDPVMGIIESELDADVYTFQTDGGTVSLSAEAVTEGNLDVRLALYSGWGDLITFADPGTTLSASLSANLAPGTYYALVEGTAPGDPTTAYGEYGSLGQYRLSAQYATSQNFAPIAAIDVSGQTQGLIPLSIAFSSARSSDSDGSIISVSWDFGDGTTSSLANPEHTYTAAGSYMATLVVVDDKGASSSASVQIVATEPIPPIADASRSTPLSGTAPLVVTLDGTNSSDPDGVVVSHMWSISNGLSLTGSRTSTTLTDPGVYTVTLEVMDDSGTLDTDTITITVTAPTPVEGIYFTGLQVSVEGNTRKGFVATATATIVDSSGKALSGASVQGLFSGIISESVSGISDRKGKVSIKSSKFRDQGSVSFQIADILLEGYSFSN